MSDEECEYDYGSDDGYDYGSDAGDDNNDGDDAAIEIENLYYGNNSSTNILRCFKNCFFAEYMLSIGILIIEGDDVKSTKSAEAIEKFERVVELETQLGSDIKWRFKALYELVKIYYVKGLHLKMLERYQLLLTYASVVTRNECTDAINTILDAIVSSTDVTFLSEMYEVTLLSLKNANNERLWFNTNLKLARVYLQSSRYNDVERVLSELKGSCQLSNGQDDPNKGTYLLEAYCLEIQLCTITRNAVRMKSIYPKTLNLNAAVADPRIMGIIREEGGKMRMSEANWKEARAELNEAFRNFQEAGNAIRAKTCLKYAVLASMLELSDINLFDAKEAKVYEKDKEIVAMSELRLSLESNDLDKFERILSNRQNHIIDEPFLMTYIQPLRRKMKEQVRLSTVHV